MLRFVSISFINSYLKECFFFKLHKMTIFWIIIGILVLLSLIELIWKPRIDIWFEYTEPIFILWYNKYEKHGIIRKWFKLF